MRASLAAIAVGAVHLAFVAVCASLTQSDNIAVQIADGLFIPAYALTSRSLLSTWLTWGAGSIVTRLLVVIGLILVESAGLVLLARPAQELGMLVGMNLLFSMILCLGCHVLMLPMRWYWDWQFAFATPPAGAFQPGRRLTLLQLFGLTAFFAFPWGFARMATDIAGGVHFAELLVVVLQFLACAALAYVVILSFMVKEWPLTRRWGILCATCLLLFLLQTLANSSNMWFDRTTMAAILTGSTLAIAVVDVGLLYACGLRLYRPRQAALPPELASAAL